MVKKFLVLLPLTVVLAVTGLVVASSQAEARGVGFSAKLRDPDGRLVGSANFRIYRHTMEVEATLRPNSNVDPNAFHGFHIHANPPTPSGNGCQADSAAEPATWFVSAGGHLSATGQTHGQHNGDLPSPLVLADGTAHIAFTTDRVDPEVLRGKALILHAKPDNFGNIPTGEASTAYRPNSPAATDLTARTGNASNRVACGVIRPSRAWY